MKHTGPDLKLVTLWLLSIIGMILHFNYRVSGIFYGTDVKLSDEEPETLVMIRTLFYHLPFIWIIFVLYTRNKLIDLGLLIVSVIYFASHVAHLIGEAFIVSPKNYSQIGLLAVVLIVSGLLAYEHFIRFRLHLRPKLTH